MRIEHTTKSFFDEATLHMSRYRKMANVISTEEEYLISDDSNQLGVILKGKNGQFYGYVLLAKDGADKFEFVDAKMTFKTQDEAKNHLSERMEKN